MNAILFDSGDELPGGLVELRGRRAEHALSVLGVTPGSAIRLGRAGGALHAEGRVVRTGGEGPEAVVVVRPGPPSPPPPRCPADLLLALPRPKCLRRLWPQLAALGPARVFVTAAEKVEKSYWGCTFLRESERDALLREGLSQACDTVPPRVEIRRRLKPFAEDEIPLLSPEGKRFFAHPGPAGGGRPGGPDGGDGGQDGGGGRDGGLGAFASACAAPGGPALVAVGPEGGWSPFECAMFVRLGFRPVSLGARVLRTDTAVVSLLAIASAAAARAPAHGGAGFW